MNAYCMRIMEPAPACIELIMTKTRSSPPLPAFDMPQPALRTDQKPKPVRTLPFPALLRSPLDSLRCGLLLHRPRCERSRLPHQHRNQYGPVRPDDVCQHHRKFAPRARPVDKLKISTLTRACFKHFAGRLCDEAIARASYTCNSTLRRLQVVDTPFKFEHSSHSRRRVSRSLTATSLKPPP